METVLNTRDVMILMILLVSFFQINLDYFQLRIFECNFKPCNLKLV